MSEKLRFDKFEVVIDSEKLRFDERSLSEYIQTEASHYDNIGAYLSLAEKNLQNKEVAYEKLFSERFVEAKEEGSSDKLAEARAKCDLDAVELKEGIVEARYAVNRLKNHLKAWDKSHDNAQSLGHMLRKQMDRLSSDIYAWQGDKVHEPVKESHKSFAESKQEGFEDNLTVDNLF